MKIAKLIAREIFDSRGQPTVECELFLDSGKSVVASAPSGASKGSFEAFELRDGGKRLMGKGVSKAIDAIENKIAPLVVGQELNAPYLDQKIIDLDGTANKKKLGANATVAVSMAMYRAQAVQEEVELFELIAWITGQQAIALPVPMLNLINGGAHSNNNLCIQEFMVMPIGAKSFRESIEASMMLSHELKELLQKRGKSSAVGDEGGYASVFEDEIDALNCLTQALINYDKKEANIFAFALDVAASQFYNAKTKKYDWHGTDVTSDELIEYYLELTKHFPLYSLEDGLDENDFDGWARMTAQLGDTMQIVGDDIFVTAVDRIRVGLKHNAANAVLIKPNQIGTITETIEAIKFCKENGLGTVISHRSGETIDTFIADLAVGTAAGQIKAGGCSRGERIAKYNRLLCIEDILMKRLLEN